MTKNHICSKDFPEIIDFSGSLKNLVQFKNSSDSKKIQVLLGLFQKNFLKSMIGSSFSKNKPKIWETFGALFAKVIDMTRLYILIIFNIKKDYRSIGNSSTHFRKKGKEPIIYVVVMKKISYTPPKFLDKPKLSGEQC